MKIALLMVVCEGEFDIACDALNSVAAACASNELVAFIVDDASASHVGERVLEVIKRTGEYPGSARACNGRSDFTVWQSAFFLDLSRLQITVRTLT